MLAYTLSKNIVYSNEIKKYISIKVKKKNLKYIWKYLNVFNFLN